MQGHNVLLQCWGQCQFGTVSLSLEGVALTAAASCTLFLFLWRLGSPTEDGTWCVKPTVPCLLGRAWRELGGNWGQSSVPLGSTQGMYLSGSTQVLSEHAGNKPKQVDHLCVCPISTSYVVWHARQSFLGGQGRTLSGPCLLRFATKDMRNPVALSLWKN